MKIFLVGPERKSKTSVAISIAAHVALLAGLAAITFHYEIFFAPPPVAPTYTTIRYVRVTPQRPSGGGTPRREGPRRSATQMTVLAPSSIPTAKPKAAAPTSPVPAVAVTIGAGNRAADPGRGAVGVRPGIPDSRIAMNPSEPGHLLKTDAQKADSALRAIYDMYLDSVRAQQANPNRAPGDWSWGGKDGDKWGWDAKGIHLGGITIPNVVLAALPMNVGPGGSNMNAITDRRADDFMRGDIKFHAAAMSEDEFRSVIRSIRERKDRERQEQMAKKRKDPP